MRLSFFRHEKPHISPREWVADRLQRNQTFSPAMDALIQETMSEKTKALMLSFLENELHQRKGSIAALRSRIEKKICLIDPALMGKPRPAYRIPLATAIQNIYYFVLRFFAGTQKIKKWNTRYNSLKNASKIEIGQIKQSITQLKGKGPSIHLSGSLDAESARAHLTPSLSPVSDADFVPVQSLTEPSVAMKDFFSKALGQDSNFLQLFLSHLLPPDGTFTSEGDHFAISFDGSPTSELPEFKLLGVPLLKDISTEVARSLKGSINPERQSVSFNERSFMVKGTLAFVGLTASVTSIMRNPCGTFTIEGYVYTPFKKAFGKEIPYNEIKNTFGRMEWS